ncbi:transferase activity, transferring acyl groups protein [[Candida] boidinii]|nr:transferase activity, transferring acyl groups protein [[Candida] boidinii]OWB77299.1 transferase activity, transferring acyl groups protein [[Candida] boidinii]
MKSPLNQQIFRRSLSTLVTEQSVSQSSCTTKFYPISEKSQRIKHFHFINVLPYSIGNIIQENFVSRNLDLKKYNILKKNHKNKDKLLEIGEIQPEIIPPLILSFEFDSTYTGGKREKTQVSQEQKNEYESIKNIPYIQTSRGGQTTYHGPGQAVIYPILDLTDFHKLTSKCYVSTIEKSVISVLKNNFKLDALTTENTGVWVNTINNSNSTKKCVEKISSIGVNIKRGITSHGVSINCSTDLSFVNDPRIVMCGLDQYKQTSILNEFSKTKLDSTNFNLSVSNVSKLFANEISSRIGISKIDHFTIDNDIDCNTEKIIEEINDKLFNF